MKKINKIKHTKKTPIIALLLAATMPSVSHGMFLIQAIGEQLFSQKKLDQEFVIAAEIGDYETVKKLLPRVSNVNIKVGIGGVFALGQASQNGHTNIVRLLLENREKTKINVNNKIDSNGCSALRQAAQEGYFEIVQALVHAGADVGIVDTRGDSPLFVASGNGHTDVVEFLLPQISKKGLKAKTDEGGFPLYVASQNGHEKVVQLLAENLDPQDRDAYFEPEGVTSLWIACRNGHHKTVKALVKAKASLDLPRKRFDRISQPDNRKRNVGGTPFWAACLNGNPKTVRFLIDAKANINEPDDMGYFPIHAATQGGDQQVIQMLLKQNPTMVNAQSVEGFTPLHVASCANNFNVAMILLAKNANPTFPSVAGQYPFEHAASTAMRSFLLRAFMRETRREILRQLLGAARAQNPAADSPIRPEEEEEKEEKKEEDNGSELPGQPTDKK